MIQGSAAEFLKPVYRKAAYMGNPVSHDSEKLAFGQKINITSLTANLKQAEFWEGRNIPTKKTSQQGHWQIEIKATDVLMQESGKNKWEFQRDLCVYI